MWIMACRAFKPAIAFAPALARNQTVGGGAGGGHAFHTGEFHIPPRSMACAAELDRFDRIEMRRVEDGGIAGIGHHGGGIHLRHMFRSRPMTGFAGHPGNQVRFIEGPVDIGSSGVAAETTLYLRASYRTVHSLSYIFWIGQVSVGR